MKEKSKKLDFCFPVYDEISEEISDITAIYLRVYAGAGRVRTRFSV